MIRDEIRKLTGIDVDNDVSIKELENNIDKYVQNDKDKEKMLDVIYLLKAGKEMNEDSSIYENEAKEDEVFEL